MKGGPANSPARGILIFSTGLSLTASGWASDFEGLGCGSKRSLNSVV